MTEGLMTPQAVADHLGIPLSTLYKWNSEGTGPKYLKIGRHARYRMTDVIAFEDSQYAAADRNGVPAA